MPVADLCVDCLLPTGKRPKVTLRCAPCKKTRENQRAADQRYTGRLLRAKIVMEREGVW